MAAGKIRVGAPVSAVVTSDGVVGTSPRVFRFNVYARPAIITNTDTTNAAFVKVNLSDASGADYLFKLSAQMAIDCTMNTRVNVKTVSVFMAAGDYDNIKVVGWEP